MHGFVAEQNRRRSVNVLAILEVGLCESRWRPLARPNSIRDFPVNRSIKCTQASCNKWQRSQVEKKKKKKKKFTF